MNFRIVDGAAEINTDDIVRLLKMTYWADNRSRETIEKSVRNSSCFGLYAGETKKLVGFARVISDYATTYYLCDVIIDPAFQHISHQPQPAFAAALFQKAGGFPHGLPVHAHQPVPEKLQP